MIPYHVADTTPKIRIYGLPTWETMWPGGIMSMVPEDPTVRFRNADGTYRVYNPQGGFMPRRFVWTFEKMPEVCGLIDPGTGVTYCSPYSRILAWINWNRGNETSPAMQLELSVPTTLAWTDVVVDIERWSLTRVVSPRWRSITYRGSIEFTESYSASLAGMTGTLMTGGEVETDTSVLEVLP